jgi:hypothetical protein
MAQTILGPSYVGIEVVRPHDVADDDDREFFVKAWCWHPRYIEHIIFIPEPSLPGAGEELRTALPGLHYPIQVRLVAYRD